MKRIFFSVSIFVVCLMVTTGAQENQKRNRGESFYNLHNSNTVGCGNIWLSMRGVGHVWDDPMIMDTGKKTEGKWISNVRAFPEIKIEAGVLNFMSVFLESRVLSYGFRPGNVAFGLKATIPDNLDLRLHGFAMGLTFLYQFMESSPTLGGYSGFMPEGFVVKGTSMEVKFLYELDLLARFSRIPLRFLTNLGTRIPFRKDRLECFQILGNTGLVYSRYGFDFFAMFSVDAFNNLFSPILIKQPDSKTIAVYFRENQMYVTLGGNVRYDNGCVLNISIPLLVSKNRESRMRLEDLVELHRNTRADLFRDEKSRGIKDPFDPWFVKWKVAGSISFPLRYKMTSAELMRNYLIVKNRKEQRKINIDQKIMDEEGKKKQKEEDKRRLEEIRRKKEEIMNAQ